MIFFSIGRSDLENVGDSTWNAGLWERCLERPGNILLVESSYHALLFSSDPSLYPTLASHCCDLNSCTIFISGIPICDIHLLSFQLILSTASTPVYLRAPAGTKILWSYFSWPLTPLTLSPSIWLMFCHPLLSSLPWLHTLVLLSLCHTHLAKPPSCSI